MTDQKYGYEHWTGKPVTPGKHELAMVPQSIMDGWQGFCSCGEWSTFVGLYDLSKEEEKDPREATFRRIEAMHAVHVEESK
jgi:hypothetical protein